MPIARFSFVFPVTWGLPTDIPLMNRAEALFGMSVRRITSLLSQTVYPVLPQLRGQPKRFERASRAYVLVIMSLLFAGVAFIWAVGPDVSRVLYGNKWVAADSLLLPGAIIGLDRPKLCAGGRIEIQKIDV